MMIAATSPDAIIAIGLALPTTRINSDGIPKIPLPMIELMIRAASPNFPIERTNDMHSPHASAGESTSRLK